MKRTLSSTSTDCDFVRSFRFNLESIDRLKVVDPYHRVEVLHHEVEALLIVWGLVIVHEFLCLVGESVTRLK